MKYAFICLTFTVIFHGTKFTKKEKHRCFSYMDSGNVLLSRAVSSQVPSALKGLTSVFGMGTGGTPSPSSPETVNFFFPHTLTTAQLF